LKPLPQAINIKIAIPSFPYDVLDYYSSHGFHVEQMVLGSLRSSAVMRRDLADAAFAGQREERRRQPV
jgi:hypothetical protein